MERSGLTPSVWSSPAWASSTLLLAAFIHVTSELTFILNSTRLLARPQPCSTQKKKVHEDYLVRERAA